MVIDMSATLKVGIHHRSIQSMTLPSSSPGPAEHPVDEIAQRTTDDQPVGGRLHPGALESEGPEQGRADGDGGDAEERAGILEHGEGGAGVLGVGEHEEVGDDHDVPVDELDRRPPLRDHVEQHDERGQPDPEGVPADQALRAQSTQSVA